MQTEETNQQGFRLSPQQTHLWAVQRGDARPFRTYSATLVEGRLEAGALREALAALVARHEILRTGFRPRPEVVFPAQVIGEPEASLDFSRELYGLPEEGRRERLASILEAQGRRDYRPEHDRPLEATLFQLSDESHLLVVNLPALCMDGAGMAHLVRELCDEYEARARGEQGGGDPVQYADLSEWLNRLLEKEEAAAERSLWRQADYSRLSALELPLESRPAPGADFDPRRAGISLSRETLARAEALAASYGAPLPGLLLALWEVLLWRAGGAPEFAVGVLCDGRSYEELEGALGLLSKYLPVACRLEGGVKVRDLVREVDAAAGRARDAQEYFDWRGVAGPAAGAGAAAFIPYCFGFERAELGRTAAGVSFEIRELYSCVDRFRLKLSLLRTRESLRAELHYDANCFTADAVALLAERYQALVRNAVLRPQARVAELCVLGDAERGLLRGFNVSTADDGEACGVPAGYPEDGCFHRLFEEQAARAPDRVAVVYEDVRLSYGELNARANRLARRLRGLGVGPETRVGIYMERSAELLVALLGVSKAGGAYVPLEPSQQSARLRHMLRETAVRVVVTDRDAGPLLDPGVIEIRLGREAGAGDEESAENLTARPAPENLSYVLFTSGSTGPPKGVAVEHRQVLNYLHAVRDRLGLEEGLSYATVSTFAADLGNTVVLPALCFGGTLHVVSAERVLDRDAYAEYSERHAIDVLKVVPSHLESLLGAARPEKVIPRKLLILGGEASRPDLVARVRALGPGCRVFNHYGPTEATVGVSTFAVGAAPADGRARTVPVGRPLANTEIYVLDGRLAPVPIMSPGEVYIGGSNLCRGYLNHASLTAEKFCPNPFSKQPGARLYRTGDLARFLSDGNIEYLGRADQQVKIRGYRVEPGEIEAALREHPSVSQAVAAVREDRPGEKTFVAYLVADAGPAPTAAELRAFCRERLPPYMTPSGFVLLKSLPLLPNGKLDRARLAGLEAAGEGPGPEVAQPQTETERRIAAVWREALQVESVGVDANFFDIGGHSLLMIWVHSRLQQMFPKKLTVVELFKYPTVRALSDFLAEGEPAPAAPPGVKDRVRRQKEAMSRRRQNLRGGNHE